MIKSLAVTLLRPTKLYYNLIVQIIKFINVKGIAHITGGGIIGNLPRIVPKKLSVKLDLNNFLRIIFSPGSKIFQN
jgi:phosphoribosylformylglycinamidine cyclo-ligase